ncbi:3-hydroxybutyrate dehydrogenase [Sphingomonas bacterium]|uniref:3-hydroxybutyrate dehydrogenase n=1 Tax=Sphingomonas bacterium TaxID=1895847 RepID=UPI0015774F43|nr:3-hydroxybutyrate dehydrogenase [Sphingomonas bacterium]
MSFLTGRTAIVTGSTSGIGLAYARALAAQGATVVINGFGEAGAIEAIRAELGGLYDPADMTRPAEIAAMVERAVAATGSVDIVVNNAGVQHVAPIADFPVERFDAIIAIVMSSAWHLIRAALPRMRERGWGRIISTGSAHSLVASPNKSAYIMAKHGLAGLTKTVALECARDNVTCNLVSPGYVWTPLVENQIPDTMRARGLTREQVVDDVLLAAQPTKRFVTPEEVAALGVFLCREEARSITGANLPVDGGWTAA